MPIKPENKALYPANWDQISLAIRKRAQNRCEICGAVNYQPHPVTGSKVILTVAHLDHNPANCVEDNLKAMCQRCHNAYDAQHRRVNANRTRSQKKEATAKEHGQLGLFGEPIKRQFD